MDKTYNIDDIIKARQISFDDGYQQGLKAGHKQALIFIVFVTVAIVSLTILVALIK